MRTAVLLFLCALAGCSSAPEPSAALRGKKVAERLGCFACHGPGGERGQADPDFAPARGWDSGTAALYLESEDDLRDWILHGQPEKTGLSPMPAYQDQLSAAELDDLVAYYRAVSGWAQDLPDEAYEGRQVALRLGCFGCHGPSGIGGMSNPGSFTGTIPPWDGEDFAELVRDEAELREWIEEGRLRRLWDNPAARHFLAGQKTKMPAYRDHLTPPELDQLVAYIQWLRRE